MESNLTSSCFIRNDEPKIDITTLDKVTELFKSLADDLKLSPKYAHAYEKRDKKKEEDFKILKKFRHIGLVEPEDDMYFVVIESKSCRLTTLGKYYWCLKDQSKI